MRHGIGFELQPALLGCRQKWYPKEESESEGQDALPRSRQRWTVVGADEIQDCRIFAQPLSGGSEEKGFLTKR